MSSLVVFNRFGASSKQTRHIMQLVSMYHAPGTFNGCLLFLSAMDLVVLNQNGTRNAIEIGRCPMFLRDAIAVHICAATLSRAHG